MSQELVYTSAPKGLKLGSRGFCTVASTTGMAKNLADRLEALTGYKHLFPPDSPQAVQNPVSYSYLRFVLGGQTYYVLSRIADAGLDYTQRSNKLAHHVVLSHAELVAAGPAWLTSQPGVFETAWARDPQLFPTGRPLPAGDLDAGACRVWQATTGDAGWAGVLAEHALKNSSDEAYLVYKPGTDVLRLFLEAQALLPHEVRWNTTFSTYFTKLPPGIECRWRGVVAGTPEALRARRLPDRLVIDLTQVLHTPPDSELVVVARHGKPRKRDGITGSTLDNERRNVAERAGYEPSLLSRLSSGKEVASQFATSVSKPPALPNQRYASWSSIRAVSGLSRRERGAWIASILILIAAFSGLAFYLTRSPIDIPEQVASDITSNDSERTLSTKDEYGSMKSRSQLPDNQPSTPRDGAKNDKKNDEQPASRTSNGAVDPASGSSGENAVGGQEDSHHEELHENDNGNGQIGNEEKRVTWDDLTKLTGEFLLPEISQSITNERWKDPRTFAAFRLKPELRLELLGSDESIQLSLQETVPSYEWNVIVNGSNGTPEPLATIAFTADGSTLSFQWSDRAKTFIRASGALRGAVLRMSIPGVSETKFVSFLPALRFPDAVNLDKDALVKNGEWNVPIAADIWIPKGQMGTAYLGIAPINTNIVTLVSGQPKSVPLADTDSELGVQFSCSQSDRPSVTLSLSLQVNDTTGERILFPKWREQIMAARERLLQEAIFFYLEQLDQDMWIRLSALRFPAGTRDAPLTRKKFERFLNRMNRRNLTTMELKVRNLLEQQSRTDPSAPPAQKYPPLQLNEVRLSEMQKNVEQLLSEAKITLRVTRRIENVDDQSGQEVPEIDVLVVGQK